MEGKTNTGGGGAHLFVIGRDTQPASVPNNTVWVNTPTRIMNFCVQNTQPGTANEGDAWLTYGEAGDSDMDISRLEVFRLKVTGVKQYLSGTWTDKTFKTYYNGTWHG